MSKIFHTLIIFLLLFCGQVENIQAAPTDCIQTHLDGRVNCIKASNWWLGYIDDEGQIFQTMKEYGIYVMNKNCAKYPGSVCGERFGNGIIDGRICKETTYCNQFTYVNNNNIGQFAYYIYDDIQPNVYIANFVPSSNHLKCPLGYSVITVSTVYYSGLCKPNASSTLTPIDSGCPTGLCHSMNEILSGSSFSN